MRKVLLPILLSFVLLCGCGKNAEASFNQFALQVAAAEEIDFTANVRAEYTNKTAEFKLGYEQNSDGAVVEILEPELVAGIKARVAPDSTTLEYEGVILDLGMLTDSDLSPMSALPLLAKTIREGHIDIAWTEEDMLVARLIPKDDVTVTLWLDSELTPLNAEITYKENTVIFIEISDWEMS